PRLPVARLVAPLGTARGGPHLPAADPPPAVVAQLIVAGQGGGRPAPRRRRLPAARLAGGGAGAKAGLSSGGVPRPPGGRVRPGRADPQRPGEVGPDCPARAVGAMVEPGPLKLQSGLVQLEFYSGARLVIEGPADLELLGTDVLLCRAGKVRA